MKYSNFTSYLLMFFIAFGLVFIVQCERDTRTDRDQYQTEEFGTDQEDRRHDATGQEGVTTERDDRIGTTPQQDYTMLEFENRDDMIRDMETLRDDLDAELEERDDAFDGDEERFGQIETDRDDLERAIDDVENATEDNWHEVRTEAAETYTRIYSQYGEPYMQDDMDERDEW